MVIVFFVEFSCCAYNVWKIKYHILITNGYYKWYHLLLQNRLLKMHIYGQTDMENVNSFTQAEIFPNFFTHNV